MRGVCKPSLYNFFVNLKSFKYKKFIFKKSAGRTSLVIQWLRLHSSNAEGKGLLSGWGTKSPHASQHKCVLNRFSCVRLCDPMNCSLPGFSVHVILQARILEWIAIPFPSFTTNFLEFSFFPFIGHTTQHEGSYFPHQGSNLCPLCWKHRFLTTRPLGESQRFS